MTPHKKEPLAPPYYPIIYVRGYAMRQSEILETTSTPYMGFNQGSTKIRQDWEGNVKKHIFESPLIRLMKDHQYTDVYEDGLEFKDEIPWRSLLIHRYYDEGDPDFGSGDAPSIEAAAQSLRELILTAREKICGHSPKENKKFKVYLVAHSMGGLVVRCFLQKLATVSERQQIEKVFTYATPHNGIEVAGINIPSFIGPFDINNFNRDRMGTYLGFNGKLKNVNSLNKKYDPEKFFCLVGTNAEDYPAAMGLSSKVVGSLSDGLVRIKNATVKGAPRAYIHRSHSGPYGIVNSEAGYQNLQRFFFGDLKATATLDVKKLPLPPKVQKKHDEGEKVRSSYYFEASVATRGSINCKLSERTKATHSAILKKYDEMMKIAKPKMPKLFSVFLDSKKIVGSDENTIVFQLELAVSSTGYEIENKFWLDEHMPGETLYRDTIALRATIQPDGHWKLRYNFMENEKWGSMPGNHAKTQPGGGYQIPLSSPKGFEADLKIQVDPS